MNEQSVEKQRLDKWLFFARVVKSRGLAAHFATGGKVRVNKEKADKASQGIKVGDVLTITRERKVVVYKVLGLGGRRGPATEAQLLYEDLTPSPLAKTESDAAISHGARPTKRERRKLDRFLDQDI